MSEQNSDERQEEEEEAPETFAEKVDRSHEAGQIFLRLVLSLGIIVVFFVVIQQLVVKPYRIPSDSMYATLKIGDRIFVNRLSNNKPKRGDIFVFSAPAGALANNCAVNAGPGQLAPCPKSVGPESGTAFVKRVVGLPGDRITFDKGRVYINDKILKEPYARPCYDTSFCSFPVSVQVPKGQYYMLGDNRDFSNDSRVWGPVPEANLIGPVVMTYWPLSRLRGI